jgi:hypothetical protein
LRFKARWLHGWPEPLLRLNGNWLETTGRLPVPVNLGTPGARNSRFVPNAGPAIYQVSHNPPLPAAGQSVVVSARFQSARAMAGTTLYYRIDPATSYTTVPMRDDGTGGDALAGDGVYSATIPGQAANTLVAFFVYGIDSKGASSRFPKNPLNNAPVPECVVMFGDGNPSSSFGIYHLWVTQTNAARWSQLSDLSNEAHDCTIVNGTRIIYNSQARFAGSPYHQTFDTPSGNLCHYKWIFPDDDKFLGATSFNKIHQPGNGAGDDGSLQREQIANSFLRALGVPWLNRRFVAVYVNGQRRGLLMEDTQTPDSDVVKEHFPNDAGGWLYKMQPWFEFAPQPSGYSIGFQAFSGCTLLPYTTTGGAQKVARYRYDYLVRRTPGSASDFTNVFALVEAAGSAGTANYVANMENMADMENWIRLFAANHAAGNWDCFGAGGGQNLYGYIGTQGTRYSLMMWDFNIVIGNSGSWGPGQNLFAGNGDPNIASIYTNPKFRRMYWRALQELVQGPLSVANSGPLIDAKYNAFVANGLFPENPNANIKSWLSQAHDSIASQIAAENATAFSVNPPVIRFNLATITGVAPVNVQTVLVNGMEYPLNWTTVTNFQIQVPLRSGTNVLSVVGVDRKGQPLPGAAASLSAIFGGALPSTAGQVVFNEIMYRPTVPGAEYVELFSVATALSLDLSGWRIQGLSYTFPPGTILTPGGFLVLTSNRPAFAAAYGATIEIFDTSDLSGLAGGHTLALLDGATNIVSRVRYQPSAPWPIGADGQGSSLQLVDARQDNWRPGNWVADFPPISRTPGTANLGRAGLPVFPTLWVNEVQAENVTGVTNAAGQHTGWVELYNPGSNSVALTGLSLANNYTNMAQWPFPASSVVAPGQYLTVFADGLTNLSTTNELHANFVLSPNSGSVALTRFYNSQPQVLDFVDYTNLPPNSSYGSLPDGQSFDRQVFPHATPGGPNDGTVLGPDSYVSYVTEGAIYSQSFDALPVPGSASVNCANPVILDGVTYSFSNPYGFAEGVVGTGGSGGLGIPGLAGWYGTAGLDAKFGASAGDQTTGGQISFGRAGDSNRALGLLATSSSGPTAFGVKFINQTTNTLRFINARATGQLWRQSNLPKTLQAFYSVDPTATNSFPVSGNGPLPPLDIKFTTDNAAVGGLAVDGMSAINLSTVRVLNQGIADWPPGAALWLVWQMVDASGKAQGLAIDDFTFSAAGQSATQQLPVAARTVGANMILSWSSSVGQTYQLQYTDDLGTPLWTSFGSPQPGDGTVLSVTNAAAQGQRFFRLQVAP